MVQKESLASLQYSVTNKKRGNSQSFAKGVPGSESFLGISNGAKYAECLAAGRDQGQEAEVYRH